MFKKELLNWERLAKRYNKESLKIFKALKCQLEKKAPSKDDLDKFGKFGIKRLKLNPYIEKFLIDLESKLYNSLTKFDSLLVCFEEQLTEVRMRTKALSNTSFRNRQSKKQTNHPKLKQTHHLIPNKYRF